MEPDIRVKHSIMNKLFYLESIGSGPGGARLFLVCKVNALGISDKMAPCTDCVASFSEALILTSSRYVEQRITNTLSIVVMAVKGSQMRCM